MQWCVHQRLRILRLALCVRQAQFFIDNYFHILKNWLPRLAAEKSATNAWTFHPLLRLKTKNSHNMNWPQFYVPHSHRCRDAGVGVQSAHATLYPRPGQCQGDAPPSTHQHRSGCGEGSDAALLQVKTDLLSASVSDCSLCSGWSPVSGCIKPVTSSSNKVELMRSSAWNLEHS